MSKKMYEFKLSQGYYDYHLFAGTNEFALAVALQNHSVLHETLCAFPQHLMVPTHPLNLEEDEELSV